MNNPSVTLRAGTNPEPPVPAQEIAHTIVQLFREQGTSMYGGEAVTQIEHALQCAALAQACGATTALTVAALLHDIGHFLYGSDDPASSAIDDLHEEHGAQWLSQYFSDDVVEPVRLHVAAKRFLCATDPVYFGQLSAQSKLSLKLQGGPMSTSEVGRFLAHSNYRDAVLLRRWDDQAKVVGLKTRSIEYYVPAIMECLR